MVSRTAPCGAGFGGQDVRVIGVILCSTMVVYLCCVFESLGVKGFVVSSLVIHCCVAPMSAGPEHHTAHHPGDVTVALSMARRCARSDYSTVWCHACCVRRGAPARSKHARRDRCAAAA